MQMENMEAVPVSAQKLWFPVPGSQQLHRDSGVSSAPDLAQQVHYMLEAPREAPSAVLRYAVQAKWDHTRSQERDENSYVRTSGAGAFEAEAENRPLERALCKAAETMGQRKYGSWVKGLMGHGRCCKMRCTREVAVSVL